MSQPAGYIKKDTLREIHSIKYLYQKRRKMEIDKLSVTLKIRKRTK